MRSQKLEVNSVTVLVTNLDSVVTSYNIKKKLHVAYATDICYFPCFVI